MSRATSLMLREEYQSDEQGKAVCRRGGRKQARGASSKRRELDASRCVRRRLKHRRRGRPKKTVAFADESRLERANRCPAPEVQAPPGKEKETIHGTYYFTHDDFSRWYGEWTSRRARLDRQ